MICGCNHPLVPFLPAAGNAALDGSAMFLGVIEVYAELPVFAVSDQVDRFVPTAAVGSSSVVLGQSLSRSSSPPVEIPMGQLSDQRLRRLVVVPYRH